MYKRTGSKELKSRSAKTPTLKSEGRQVPSSQKRTRNDPKPTLVLALKLVLHARDHGQEWSVRGAVHLVGAIAAVHIAVTAPRVRHAVLPVRTARMHSFEFIHVLCTVFLRFVPSYCSHEQPYSRKKPTSSPNKETKIVLLWSPTTDQNIHTFCNVYTFLHV